MEIQTKNCIPGEKGSSLKGVRYLSCVMEIQIKMRKDDKVDKWVLHIKNPDRIQPPTRCSCCVMKMWITYLCKRLCIMDLCVYLNS